MVIDIETVGALLDDLDAGIRQCLLKKAETPEDIEKIGRETGLSPLTAQVVAIGTFDPDAKTGNVYYQSPGELPLPFDEDGMRYICGDEAAILRMFWDEVKSTRCIITFNGRGFDGPFLLVRSAMHRIKPTRNLMPNRYTDEHIDLFDRLSFYGSTSRRHGLDMWCRAMGITSPKVEGSSGADVGDMYRAGRYLDIARYCGRDIIATCELYELWDRYIKS